MVKSVKMIKVFRCLIILFVVLFVVLCGYILWANTELSVEHFVIKTDKLSFDSEGFTIAHLSDYHNSQSDKLTNAIITSLNEEKPDAIVLTGDLIDRRKTDVKRGVDFVLALTEIAPVYYVTGNHEYNVNIRDQLTFTDFICEMESIDNLTVLRGESAEIALENDETINIHGIDDPYFHCVTANKVTSGTEKLCSAFSLDKKQVNVLLAHQPEQLDVYAKHGFDFVYSGHAHGGQVRLFGIGLIAPDQGIFPKYTNGLYKKDNTTLVVSRGIGNSVAPVRVFDNPHLIYTEIK